MLVYPCFISDDFIHWPTLFLEVLSLDSWERFRTEGYAYVSIPNKAGERIIHTLSQPVKLVREFSLVLLSLPIKLIKEGCAAHALPNKAAERIMHTSP